MLKQLALALVRKALGKWLRTRALHVPDAKVEDLERRFKMEAGAWREVEAFLQDYALGKEDELLK